MDKEMISSQFQDIWGWAQRYMNKYRILPNILQKLQPMLASSIRPTHRDDLDGDLSQSGF